MAQFKGFRAWKLEKPDKPFAVGTTQTNHVTIAWNSTSDNPQMRYQVRYKNVIKDKQWKFHSEYLYKKRFKLEGLEPESKFVFQVRMISENDVESPFSDTSDEIETSSVPDSLLCGSDSFKESMRQKSEIEKRHLPFTAVKSVRNERSKTRKFVIGMKKKYRAEEKTIIFLGPTGAGKSTMIDALLNYIFNVEWEQKYRFTVKNLLEDEEKAQISNQALSQTSWITCYTIHPTQGNRLQYTLTIIDTPGFASVHGIEEDRRITSQVEYILSEEAGMDINSLDAVCFVMKSPDGRFTRQQRYIFDSILSMLQRDIMENICIFATFADDKPPKVLAAFEEAKLPHSKYFSFNSSALFAANTEDNSRSHLDWKMGKRSFELFFKHLTILKKKSIAESKEVLRERRGIEITVENMRIKLDAALIKIQAFKDEIKLLKTSEEAKTMNKNFTYTTTRPKLVTKPVKSETKEWNLNCKICQTTCHRRCLAWNFNFVIKRCDAIKDGRCSQCPNHCPAENHVNEQFEHKYEIRSTDITYTDITKRFDSDEKDFISHREIIYRMETEMEQFEKDIEHEINTILECNIRLRKIALREDPLRMTDLLDTWIREEQTTMSEGWSERVSALQEFRKKANLPDFAKNVKQQLSDAIDQAKRKIVEMDNKKDRST